MAEGFDFDGYRRAFETKDVGPWLEFYADEAVWIEYKHTAPPRAPVRMEGKAAIAAFLRGVAAGPVELAVSHEVLDSDRIAFRVWCELPDGRRIVENCICELRGGLIVEHVDVEAWD